MLAVDIFAFVQVHLVAPFARGKGWITWGKKLPQKDPGPVWFFWGSIGVCSRECEPPGLRLLRVVCQVLQRDVHTLGHLLQGKPLGQEAANHTGHGFTDFNDVAVRIIKAHGPLPQGCW